MYKKLLLVSVLALVLQQVCGQDACEELARSDLGSSDVLSEQGLISRILTPGGEVSDPVDVRILDMNIVCEAQHMVQDRYRYTSVVVTFNCFSTNVNVPECADSSMVLTEQFDLGCAGGEWSRTILTITDLARTESPIATLTTPEDNGCLLCIHPSHAGATGPVDIVSHCQGCFNCTTGLQRCYEDDSFNQVCCVYFHNSSCVTECPENYGPDEDFECQLQCGELSDENGDFMYNGGRFVGSMATLICDTGYEVEANSAVCLETGQWSFDPTCNRIACGEVTTIDNGQISYSENTFHVGTIATYECNIGFILEGPEARTCMPDRVWTPNMDPTCTPCSEKIENCAECMSDKDGTVTCTVCVPPSMLEDNECKDPIDSTNSPQAGRCDPPCIIGIVLAILAVIIIGIVVAVVAFVLYKYLNDPATKLAKTDANGLNGVARDNPLYVDPATVTEDGGLDGMPTETTPLDSEA